MKKFYAWLGVIVMILAVFTGCEKVPPVNTENDFSIDIENENKEKNSSSGINEDSIKKIVSALFGAGMLGQTWTQTETNESLYDQSIEGGCPFIVFYCAMNPDYPSEINASTFEQFIQKYFDVSTDYLHKFVDYNTETYTYRVSPDISVDMIRTQIEDFFKIDSIMQENSKIKVDYRIIWGKMAASGDGSDTAYAGYVLLRNERDTYGISSINVTEDNSEKYDYFY